MAKKTRRSVAGRALAMKKNRKTTLELEGAETHAVVVSAYDRKGNSGQIKMFDVVKHAHGTDVTKVPNGLVFVGPKPLGKPTGIPKAPRESYEIKPFGVGDELTISLGEMVPSSTGVWESVEDAQRRARERARGAHPSPRLAFRLQLDAFLARGLSERLADADLSALGSPEDVAERMLAALDAEASAPYPWDETVGPFYSTATLTQRLGVTRQALNERAKRRTILQVKTSDGEVLYPAFQFTERDVDPRVRSVLQAFQGVPVDGWAIAMWLTTPAASLDDRTPLDDLREPDRALAPVLGLAAETAARWSE